MSRIDRVEARYTSIKSHRETMPKNCMVCELFDLREGRYRHVFQAALLGKLAESTTFDLNANAE